MRQNTAQEDNNTILSIAMEEQLANDLAFVAISDTGPQAVRSATVQVFQNPKQFVITLASNERVPQEVQASFNKMKEVLRSCAIRSEHWFPYIDAVQAFF